MASASYTRSYVQCIYNINAYTIQIQYTQNICLCICGCDTKQVFENGHGKSKAISEKTEAQPTDPPSEPAMLPPVW